MKVSFVEKLGASVLITAWLLWGSNMVGDLLVEADDTGVQALRSAATEAPAASQAAPAKPAPAAPAAKGGGALALLASADAGAGEKVFKKCKACHSAKKGAAHKVGPNLWDVVGRAKAAAGGFRYSGALAGLGGAWTYGDLDAFLTRPKDFAPGTKMTFAGLKKAADRAAVIAYLRSLSDSPKPLP